MYVLPCLDTELSSLISMYTQTF